MTDERATESGILLPEPDAEAGHPVCVAFLPWPAGQVNIAAPTPDDVREIADRIYHAQRMMQGGDEPGLIEFKEPQYGQTGYLTPFGVSQIWGVIRGYMAVVDPLAAMPQPRRAGPPITIARPNGRR